MKLTYIANSRMPTEKAHGVQITKMCSAFVFAIEAKNKQIDLELVIPYRLNKIKQDAFDYYGVKKNFKIKKLPCLNFFGFWIQKITFSLFLFFYLIFKKTDIIYTREKLFLFLCLFKKNIFYEAHTFPKRYFFYSFFLKKVKGIVVITNKLKELFIEKGTDVNKIIVAPDAVDLEEFNINISKQQAREKLGLSLDKKIVVYTGHLYKWKGVNTLLITAKNFQFSIFNFQTPLFVFVGGTEKDVEEFRVKAKKMNLKNVMIVGHRPHFEIPLWLKAADILVLPNSGKQEISRHWTSPLKMFEYMASQRPIVASDLPSIREVLNERNAILVESDNPQVLLKGIKNLLQNSDFSIKIARQAYLDVKNFTWLKRAEQILRFVGLVPSQSNNVL